MAKVITYGCKECGCEIIVSGSHETHLRPIFCCGVEVTKIAPAAQKTASEKSAAKKTKEKKVVIAAKKVTKKTTGKRVKKKTTPRKNTSGR